MKGYIFILLSQLALLAINQAFAGSSNLNTKYGTVILSPIIVFEKAQKLSPNPHTKMRTLYGIRATLSKGIISLEGEYTFGNDSEYFSSSNLTIIEDVKKVKLGLKSSFYITSFLSWSLRGGAEAKQSLLTKKTLSTSTQEKSATYVNPYVGTDLSIHFFQSLSLSAGFTAVQSDYPNKGLIETSTDIGINFRY